MTNAFTPTPSLERSPDVAVVTDSEALSASGAVTALGVPVAAAGGVPDVLGVDRLRLAAAGFDAQPGSALAVPTAEGPALVAVGTGRPEGLDPAVWRNAAAAFGRAAATHGEVALSLAGVGGGDVAAVAQAVVEGILLARYRYDPLRTKPPSGAPGAQPVAAITLVVDPGAETAATEGARRGQVLASATQLARDLANTPHNHLSATRIAEVAVDLGPDRGLGVEVFDEDALRDLGCGGLLGVNAGSTEPPRMVKLTYTPDGDGDGAAEPAGRLTLVGKGIMYDSGGIALKPGDEVHAQMKNDMSGAAAILAAMSVLRSLGCRTAVTGYLMCTDNMPSGTALALGDVITMRGGTTVEVVNTDAEGRLVMADALVLATEEPVDAIVDIATLTGACMRALGTQVAGVMGTHGGLVDQVRAAAGAVDEPVWPLPLEPRYRKELDSTVADLRNLGGANAGALTAGLFLAEFVGDVPWAHVDIAGTAQSTGDAGWQTAGCSGFGARLLTELALAFTPPARQTSTGPRSTTATATTADAGPGAGTEAIAGTGAASVARSEPDVSPDVDAGAQPGSGAEGGVGAGGQDRRLPDGGA